MRHQGVGRYTTESAGLEVLQGLPRLTAGYWAVPEKPGLGIEIDEAVAARHPFQPEVQQARAAVLPDGTVVDW